GKKGMNCRESHNAFVIPQTIFGSIRPQDQRSLSSRQLRCRVNYPDGNAMSASEEMSQPDGAAGRFRRLAMQIRRACHWEATARKPGNVHPGASFADLTYEDFLRSADVVAPILARAGAMGVGVSILRSVEATLRVTPSNSNLGIVLLIAPLAAV